jgi:hypothetical protein
MGIGTEMGAKSGAVEVTSTLPVWVGHSCPMPLTLILILILTLILILILTLILTQTGKGMASAVPIPPCHPEEAESHRHEEGCPTCRGNRGTCGPLHCERSRGKIVLPCKPRFPPADRLFFLARCAAGSISAPAIVWMRTSKTAASS